MQEEKEIETTEQINPYQSVDGLLKEFEQNYKASELTIINAVRDIIEFNYSKEAAEQIVNLPIFKNINSLGIGEQIYLLNKFIKITILLAYSFTKVKDMENATVLIGGTPLKGSVMDWYKWFAYRVVPYFKTYNVLSVYGI